MLIRQPHDGVDGPQGLYAVGLAQEFLLVGETHLDFGVGELGFRQRVGGGAVELRVVFFVDGAEVEIAFEMVRKTRCIL